MVIFIFIAIMFYIIWSYGAQQYRYQRARQMAQSFVEEEILKQTQQLEVHGIYCPRCGLHITQGLTGR